MILYPLSQEGDYSRDPPISNRGRDAWSVMACSDARTTARRAILFGRLLVTRV